MNLDGPILSDFPILIRNHPVNLARAVVMYVLRMYKYHVCGKFKLNSEEKYAWYACSCGVHFKSRAGILKITSMRRTATQNLISISERRYSKHWPAQRIDRVA